MWKVDSLRIVLPLLLLAVLQAASTTATPNPCGCPGETSTPTTTIAPTKPTVACGCTADDLPPPSLSTSVKPLDNCDESCCGQVHGAKLPLQGDCQRFVICLNQRQTVMLCPNNLHYSAASGQCDFPQYAKCPWTYQPPSGPAAGPSGTYCSVAGRCVGQSDGTTFPDAENRCSSNYIVCQCECEVVRSCSAPLMFNTGNNVCDWPNRFNC